LRHRENDGELLRAGRELLREWREFMLHGENGRAVKFESRTQSEDANTIRVLAF